MNDRTPERAPDERASGESPIEAQLVAPPSVDGEIGQSNQASPSGASIMQSKGAVLAVLFLVTGALGIPLLWVNPNFSAIEKVVWSIIVGLYTAVFVAIVGAIVMWCYRIIVGS